jgi:hypothetical protein
VTHCPPALLDDLADLLDEVRVWAGVVEKGPGVFYAGREPFLHFHLTAEGGRRGDVKGRGGWIAIELPRPISARRRETFRRELRRRYLERAGSKSSGLRGRKTRSKASHKSFE